MTQSPRFAPFKLAPDVTKAMLAVEAALGETGIERGLGELVRLRASQINGCAACIFMHVQDARSHGEAELRLQMLNAWRESSLFTDRERAALAWTEILTRLPEHGVPGDVYDRVRTQLSEKELSDLTFSVMAINAWNRLNVGFTTVPGSADKAYGLDKAGLE